MPVTTFVLIVLGFLVALVVGAIREQRRNARLGKTRVKEIPTVVGFAMYEARYNEETKELEEKRDTIARHFGIYPDDASK